MKAAATTFNSDLDVRHEGIKGDMEIVGLGFEEGGGIISHDGEGNGRRAHGGR